MADLNKLRQVNPHWTATLDNYDGDIHNSNTSEASKYYNKVMNPSKYTKDDIEQAKCSIVEKILKHFDDTLFEMICEEMHQHYIFQSDNYLTEAGYEQFEDEWFEFYHEYHGDIMYKVMQNITN